MKCLLDLDGVLCDFHTHWHKFHPPHLYPDPWPAGEWSIAKVHGLQWTDTCKNLNLDFWTTMPWMQDGCKILALLESYFGQENICILTSNHVEDAATAAFGKVKWIETHLPEYKHRYFLGAAKGFLAHRDVILIDDKNENVDDFINQGGQAILVPRPWNRDYAFSGYAYDKLASFLT